MGAVLPASWAVILDARTGKLLRREPLEIGITHATFSPDGERVFLSNGHLNTVTEARAEDFRPRRELGLTAAASIDEAFLQPEGGALVVPTWRGGDDPLSDQTLDFVRVGDAAIESVPTGIKARVYAGLIPQVDGSFIVARGGRLGFAVYREGGAEGQSDESAHMIADTFDLQTLTRLCRIDLGAKAELSDLFASHDGSELFAISESPPAVRVYDAKKGSLSREAPAGPRNEGLVAFARRSREGDSLLLNVWAPDLRYKKARLARLTPGGKLVTVGEEALDIVEAGGAWYAADERGRRLSAFDREGRPRWSREIAAPAALRSDDHHARPPAKGIYVSPDGARVVVIVGVPAGLMNF